MQEKATQLLREFAQTANNLEVPGIEKVHQAIALLQNTESPTTRLARMVTRQGFISLFYETQKQLQCTGVKAFELLNYEYYKYTNKYRFASYASFKCIKNK